MLKVKTDENWWKLANTDRKFLHIFWTTWGNSMKFSGKMCLKIVLKVTKNQGFTLSLEDTFFEKPQGGGSNWPPSPAVLGLNSQFAVVLNGIICFSVRSCDNSLLVLKSFSRSFVSQAKWYKRFSVTGRP